MKTINPRKIIFLLLTLIPISALAIPDIDLSRFAKDDVTIMDEATGLEWVNLTQTVGDSYYYSLNRTQPGQQYEGFRFATSVEVTELFDVFQLPLFNSSENTELGHLFMDIFGITDIYIPPGGGARNTSARGFVEPGHLLEGEWPMVPAYGLSVINRDDGFSDLTMQRGTTGYNPALSHHGFASFLVRDHGKPHTVPEINAGTAPIALSLLLFTALMRWERRKS